MLNTVFDIQACDIENEGINHGYSDTFGRISKLGIILDNVSFGKYFLIVTYLHLSQGSLLPLYLQFETLDALLSWISHLFMFTFDMFIRSPPLVALYLHLSQECLFLLCRFRSFAVVIAYSHFSK